MFIRLLAYFLVVSAICMVGVSSAAVISEDVAFWYQIGSGPVLTQFNPSTDWLGENANSLLVKVQQTVYDQTSTALILTANGDDPNTFQGGFLYAYSVTNIDWRQAVESNGIQAFGVNWGPSVPLLVTTDQRQLSPYWLPEYDPPGSEAPMVGPAWLWRPSQPISGLLPGETVGGFWAVAQTGEDGILDGVMATGEIDVEPILLWGKTTGPVPEPSGIIALACGLGGIGVIWRRRV